MTEIFLVRHGQTLWNLEGRLQGWLDSDLSDFGKKQADQAKKRLEKLEFDAIYSSDRGRAYQTALRIVGDEKRINTHQGLREMSFGEWEGNLIEDVKEEYPQAFWALFNAADKYESVGGEDYPALMKRVVPVLSEIEEKHKGGKVLIVSHALTIKTILAHYEGRAFGELWDAPFIEGGSVSIIEIKDKPSISAYGDADHLKELSFIKKSV